MTQNSKIKSIMITSILIPILFLLGCGGPKEENSSNRGSTDTVKMKQTAPKQKLKKTGSFNIDKMALASLDLHAAEPEAKYDANAPIIFRVELFSPRAFAILNHNRYLKEREKPLELPQAKADQSIEQWWQKLKLTFNSPDGKSGELKFHASFASQKKTLDLGQGEVGSIEIIVGENSFPQAGKFNIKAAWKSGQFGLIHSESLPITLVKGLLSEADRILLHVKDLLLREENRPALQIIKKLAEENPGSYKIGYYLAEALEKNNRLKEALTQYQKALTLFPTEKPGDPWEPPVGLYEKIKNLMKKLGKGNQSVKNKNDKNPNNKI